MENKPSNTLPHIGWANSDVKCTTIPMSMSIDPYIFLWLKGIE